MKTPEQYMLGVTAEECNEVAQRCSKADRFTLAEIQPDTTHGMTNAERLVEEYVDFQTAIRMMEAMGMIVMPPPDVVEKMMRAKVAKITKYFDYSKKRGTVGGDLPAFDLQA